MSVYLLTYFSLYYCHLFSLRQFQWLFIYVDHMNPLFPCERLVGMIFWSTASNCVCLDYYKDTQMKADDFTKVTAEVKRQCTIYRNKNLLLLFCPLVSVDRYRNTVTNTVPWFIVCNVNVNVKLGEGGMAERSPDGIKGPNGRGFESRCRKKWWTVMQFVNTYHVWV